MTAALKWNLISVEDYLAGELLSRDGIWRGGRVESGAGGSILQRKSQIAELTARTESLRTEVDKVSAERDPSKLPWKATKERLQQALDEMAKNLGKNSELGKTTDAMRKEAGQILEAMGKHGLLSRPQVSTFAAWVNNNIKLTPINVGGNKLLEIYTKNAELVIPPPQVGVQ